MKKTLQKWRYEFPGYGVSYKWKHYSRTLKMAEIKNSNVATGGSTIKDVFMNNSKNEIAGDRITISTERKKTFGLGFFSGVLASLLASGIWYLINTYFLS